MCVFQDLLPSEEHVRVVRNLVKHLHYFANSTVGDLSAMDELKRFVGNVVFDSGVVMGTF
jgi:sphingomyelin phosphodiesterase 4